MRNEPLSVKTLLKTHTHTLRHDHYHAIVSFFFFWANFTQVYNIQKWPNRNRAYCMARHAPRQATGIYSFYFFRKFIFEILTKLVRQPSNPGSDWKEILIFGCIRIVLFYEVTVQIRTILKHPKMSYFSNTVLTFQQFPALCSIRTCAI